MIAPALTKLRIMAPMVRPTQLLHPQREPAPVRPAATVLLLRDTPQGIEVLMTRRSMTASFAPGAYVFPGGGVDALDAAAHAQASRRETQSDLHLTQAIAAIRESFEELGILLARREDGTMANANDIAALDRKAPFAPQCAARGLSLAPHGKTSMSPELWALQREAGAWGLSVATAWQAAQIIAGGVLSCRIDSQHQRERRSSRKPQASLSCSQGTSKARASLVTMSLHSGPACRESSSAKGTFWPPGGDVSCSHRARNSSTVPPSALAPSGRMRALSCASPETMKSITVARLLT